MEQRDRLDFLTDNWHATRPDIDISPWQVWGRITRLHEIFQLKVVRPLRKHGLTFNEFETLGALVLRGPPYSANPNQIARFNLLTSGGLANLLARMEKEGLIKRRPDTSDKRGVIVELTQAGLEHFNTSVLEENEVEHDLLERLSSEERTILGMLLRKLLLSVDPFQFDEAALVDSKVIKRRDSPSSAPRRTRSLRS